MAIWHSRLGLAPKQDYKPRRPGHLVVPWSLHPKATRGAAPPPPADLTPFEPPVGNQSSIGACNSYGTKDALSTSLARAGHPTLYWAALPLYRAVRCLERAGATSGALPPLQDSGANPDDALKVAQLFGMQTSAEECGEAGPSDVLSTYEDMHVNDEPTLAEFEHDSSFKVVGGFDIVSTGQQRINDVSSALAAGYAVGISVYAADERFQGYVSGVMPDPPAGVGCDHWVYIVASYDDASGNRFYVVQNSWGIGWGCPWGGSKGGCFIAGPGIIQAADCLIVYAVSEVQP